TIGTSQSSPPHSIATARHPGLKEHDGAGSLCYGSEPAPAWGLSGSDPLEQGQIPHGAAAGGGGHGGIGLQRTGDHPVPAGAAPRVFAGVHLGPPIGEDLLGHVQPRSEEHTSELQSRFDLVCRLLLEKKNEEYS